jgi:hypothetical protein
MRAEFDKNSPLWNTRAWLDANRNENGSPYDLAIPFPKRILTESDLDKSFVDLQLFPRASLLLIPKRFSNVSARPAPSGASEQPGVVTGVTRAAGGVLGYLNPLTYLWGPAAPPAEAANQRASSHGSAVSLGCFSDLTLVCPLLTTSPYAQEHKFVFLCISTGPAEKNPAVIVCNLDANPSSSF